MISIYEALLEGFAEQAEASASPKERIIAERNLVVGACAVASERHEPSQSRDIFLETLARHGLQPTGAVDTSNWSNTLRTIHARITPVDSLDTDEILVSLHDGNPYLDLSVASHPAGRGTERQLF